MFQSYRLLGTKITPTTWPEQETAIRRAVERSETCVIVSQNIHGIYTYLTDEKVRDLHNDPRTLVHIDGMPVVWLGRLSGLPVRRRHRTAWTDCIHPLLALAESSGWRVYYVGGATDVFSLSLVGVRRHYPSLEFEGHAGFFDAVADSADNRAILREIAAFDPHLVIIGMGMGRQERWVRDNLDEVGTRVVVTCGAVMDYLAGVDTPPPRWLGQLGLEWMVRLVKHPHRVWKRYLIEPWIIAWLVLVSRPLRQKV